MTLAIENESTQGMEFDYEALAHRVISHVIDRLQFPYEVEVNLTLVDEADIQQLNREYRSIDRVTDVLSFPMLEYPAAGDFSLLDELDYDSVNPDTDEVILGDIVICIPRAFAQAEEYGHSHIREYAFLIVHSMLHLFGYDHIKPEDAAIMEPLQEQLLQELDIIRE